MPARRMCCITLKFCATAWAFDELKKKVVNPLKRQKIGAYYGCLLLRPEHRAGL